MAQDDTEGLEDSAAFIPDPEELRRVAEEVGAQYPPPRLGTELVLLEVDPRRTHAYWNIDAADHEAARRQAGPGDHPLVLRMSDVTHPGAAGPAPFDVEVQGLQNHWSVDLWEPGRAYVAEIGLRLADGGLVGIARSNRVETPRAGQSESAEVITLDVGETDIGPVAAERAAVSQERAPTPAMTLLPAPGEAAEVLQNRYPDPLPESAPAAAPEEPAAPPQAIPAPPPSPVPARAIPPLAVGPWPTAEEVIRHLPDVQEQVAALLQAPVPAAAARAPQTAAGPVPTDTASSSSTVSPGPTVAPAAAPAAPVSALDSYVNLSSFVNGRSEVDLEVNVELHIYGRAKPGAQLTFQGQRVALRPDGTFSIRKPLPQGAVVLPLDLRPAAPDAPGPKA